ncbi:Exonuclease 3'-5' domain-containing protein 2 [Geodia barretti]|uniref:Exonuclease 3'-5' domain-containing protein 2 n=2 Tax=Geodia barretti TaxID=519541 RepID=A0AA35WYV1_GEOBA|nr:Exonuclease 3'-5' domain-containing protein 2 [Geodia barretti]
MAAVAEFLRCTPEDITPDMIQEAAEIDTRLQNSEFSPHAELVVRAVREEGGRQGLLEFQRRWRQHFLDTMNPRFLPELWSVDHNPHQL